MAKHIKVNSVEEAWLEANRLFPTDYEKDEESSLRAGYPIYRSNTEFYNYICDLGDRLEVNLKEGNKTINIWINNNYEEVRKQLSEVTKKLYS